MKKYECDMIPPEALEPGRCNWCGKKLPRNRDGSIKKTRRWCSRRCSWAYTENHFWTVARKEALYRDRRKCVKCGSRDRLEVNHIEPLVGRGYHAGCCHHQTNLETVCKGCHVTITKRQREERQQES